MAVEMMMSATQDFMNMNAGADSGSSGAKGQVGGQFEDSLASAAKQNAMSKGGKVSKSAAKSQQAAAESAKAADAPEAAVAVEEAQAMPAPLDADALRAMLSQLNASGEDADITVMIEDARTKMPQTSRFDPDAILDAMMAGSGLDTEAEQIIDEDSESDITAGQLLAAIASVQTDDPDIAEASAITDDAVLVVGKDESGEIAVKPLIPEQTEELQGDVDAAGAEGNLIGGAEAQEVKEPVRAETAIKSSPAKEAPAEKEQAAEEAPRAVQAEVPETANRSEDRAASGDKRESSDAKPVDERLAEIVADMREKRESMESGSDKGDMMNRRPQMASRTQQSTSRTAAAVRKAADSPSGASVMQDSSTREVPSFETLASKLRAAEDALSMTETEMTPRVGMTYMLDRGNAFGDGLTNVLEFMRVDGTPEARVIVDPPALGHIDISIRAAEGGLQATFRVDSDHLKQMVQQQIDILRSSLEDQGIHVSTIAVDIKNKDEQSGSGASHAKGGKNKRSVAGIDGDDAEETTQSLVRLDLERGTLHWVA